MTAALATALTAALATALTAALATALTAALATALTAALATALTAALATALTAALPCRCDHRHLPLRRCRALQPNQGFCRYRVLLPWTLQHSPELSE